MTSEAKGSGMLSVENDDDTAALQCEPLDAAEIAPIDITPWNTYPWYRHDQTSGLTSQQVTEGIEPLLRLINLMPRLNVVLPQGSEAQLLWKRFTRKHPDIAGRYAAGESPPADRSSASGTVRASQAGAAAPRSIP
ncbi:hypothetical protein D6T63_17575 [Arthrobacter cheniae]|uniref:Uncharacterized protein n=1 Tax=Arthrobacter cheniae TaxID=1258888 RepID=A0A3A5M7J1_9MICC|nr:hypothetical protein [Arthrobacter cheniae]RJT75631.1 hypothetical protein D6T63_17575 [Arthrobacter cheniae]